MAELVRTAFVCGHPIAHSRSPLIHGHWLARYGIRGSYMAVDVTSEKFDAFIGSIRTGSYVGGNVTIPHKEEAFRTVDRLEAAAETIGAVNTLWLEDGLIHGANTDAYGFAANLDDQAPGWAAAPGAAVVVGAGGASRAVLHALHSRGFRDIRIVNRTLSRAESLAKAFGASFSAHPLQAAGELLSDTALLVNTTSLGMHGETDAGFDLERLPGHALVTDIVYVPLETPLLAAARRRGLKAVDGLGMLLHQAVPGFEKWFGTRPEVTTALRDAVIADIAEKAA